MGVLQRVEGVGLAAGGASAGGAVLRGAAGGLWAGHGGWDTDGGQAVRTETVHLGHRLWNGLVPRVSLRQEERTG